MSQISVDSFIYGTNSIAKEKPTFKVGHDGSDGSCDSLGLIRGGLLRSGATKIKFMKEPNQFARKTAVNLQKRGFVKRGQVLLKAKDINDSATPLPSKYCEGGVEFTGDLTNYVDVALVIKDKPVEIMYMSKDGIVKTKDLTEWNYVCDLPYVLYGGIKKMINSAIVHSDNNSPIKMYEESSFSSKEIAVIPNDMMIILNDSNKTWANISYGDKTGYVLAKFIKVTEVESTVKVSEMDRAELEKAYAILGKVLGYIK